MSTVIVGDVHWLMEYQPFVEQLKNLIDDPEITRVIFIGDIAGTKKDSELTKAFYAPDSTLWDKDKIKYAHYGHALSCQGEEVINLVKEPYLENLKRSQKIMRQMKAKGIDVVVMKGNRDRLLPWEFKNNPSQLIETPSNITASTLSGAADYIAEAMMINNGNQAFVLLPWPALLNPVPNWIIEGIEKTDQKISIIAHGVPNWEVFKKEPNNEGKITTQNLTNFLRIISTAPNDIEVIHGHVHEDDYNPINEKMLIIISERSFQCIYMGLGSMLKL